MIKNLYLFLIVFFSINLSAQKLKGDELVGTWIVGNSKAKINIYKNGSSFNGKIVWLKEPTYSDGKPKIDKNNPDVAKQKQTLIGLDLLKDFVFDDGHWDNGTIYDPENGKTYKCKITYREGKLDVRGYIGFSLIGRTDVWFRCSDIK
jgi:uncharacterized protein (DUF2147 family)